MHKNLSIIITNYNTHIFVDFLLEQIEKLTSQPFTVYIHDNGSKKSNYRKLVKIIDRFDNLDIVLIATKDRSHPSVAHGNALDRTIRLVRTQFFCIFDSDCVPLCKNWDEILISKLDKGLSVIGSPYYSGPNATHKKYDDFPAQFFAMFITSDYHKANTSCKAIPPFTKDHLDTCMQWKPDFLRASLKSEVFHQKNTRYETIEGISPVLCVCYYFNEKLIGSHFGRGATSGVEKYSGFSLVWKIPLINKVIRNLVAKAEIVKWKKLLKKIS